jgi:hypothetical protein
MLALMALIGDEGEAGYDTVCIDIKVDKENGKNYFEPSDNPSRKYVIKKFEDSYYSSQINEIIK